MIIIGNVIRVINVEYKDIELTQDELEYIEKYGKNWSDDYKKRYMDDNKAARWVSEHCMRDEEHSWSKQTGRCIYEGNNRTVKKNGEPLTDDDIEAIKRAIYGQRNIFTVSEDKMYVDHFWECDSSD